MAISSVGVLNSDGVSATFAQFRQSDAETYLATEPQVVASAVSHISPAGKALVSLESFQASAGAVLDSLVPPTVSDFKVLIQGVVGAINSIRESLNAGVASPQPVSRKASEIIEKAERIAEKSKEQSDKLREIGVESGDGNQLGVNIASLSAVYEKGAESAFKVLSTFVSTLSHEVGSGRDDRAKERAEAEEGAHARPERAESESGQSRNESGAANRPPGESALAGYSYAAGVAVATYAAVDAL